MPIIQVVSGARKLNEDESKIAWGYEILESALKDPDIEVVVAGDAPGPDRWAASLAAVQGRYAGVFYYLDGTIRGSDGRAFARWCAFGEVPKKGTQAYFRWPPTRNAVMIRQAAARSRSTGCDARILALLDPESQTHGTMHTVRLAKAAMMDVTIRKFGEDP